MTENEDELLDDETDAVAVLNAALNKASKTGGDDKNKGNGDDDYNEDYLKKHMGRYMKENGMKMSKAQEVEAAAAQAGGHDGGEIDSADAVLIDGTGMFKAFVEFANGVQATLNEMNERIGGLEDGVTFASELNKAQAQVLIQNSETLKKVSETPQLAKAQITGGQPDAQEDGGGAQAQPTQSSEYITKAQEIGMATCKKVLWKAATQDGNKQAATAMTALEASRGDWSMVHPKTAKLVVDLHGNMNGGQ